MVFKRLRKWLGLKKVEKSESRQMIVSSEGGACDNYTFSPDASYPDAERRLGQVSALAYFYIALSVASIHLRQMVALDFVELYELMLEGRNRAGGYSDLIESDKYKSLLKKAKSRRDSFLLLYHPDKWELYLPQYRESCASMLVLLKEQYEGWLEGIREDHLTILMRDASGRRILNKRIREHHEQVKNFQNEEKKITHPFMSMYAIFRGSLDKLAEAREKRQKAEEIAEQQQEEISRLRKACEKQKAPSGPVAHFQGEVGDRGQGRSAPLASRRE